MKLRVIKLSSVLLILAVVVGFLVFILYPSEKYTGQTAAAEITPSHKTVSSTSNTILVENNADHSDNFKEEASDKTSDDTPVAIAVVKGPRKTVVKTHKKYESEIDELIVKYTDIYIAALEYLENSGNPTNDSESSELSDTSEPLEQPGMGPRWCTTDRCKVAEKLELDATTKVSSLQEMRQTLEKSSSALKESIDFYNKEQNVADNLEELRGLFDALNNLVERYQLAINDYSEAATVARLEKEAEIAEAIRAANSNGAIGNGLNTYPMQNNCPRDNLRYSYTGGYVCQCTSYAGWKVKERYGITISAWGNANNWANTAKKLGYRVDHTPEAGSVAVSTGGQWGHVMWVENVNSNGTINVSEYNNSYSAASHLPGDFGYRIGASAAGLWFIHFSNLV